MRRFQSCPEDAVLNHEQIEREILLLLSPITRLDSNAEVRSEVRYAHMVAQIGLNVGEELLS